jgi:hypothetical protein
MNYSNSSESSLRASVQTCISILENALEEDGQVRGHDTADIPFLEQQLDLESDKFIASVTNRVQQIRDGIKACRPMNKQEADYKIRMSQYQQFLESSLFGMSRVTDWIEAVFDKAGFILKDIMQWMAENAQIIVTTLEQIRDAFLFINLFFNRH